MRNEALEQEMRRWKERAAEFEGKSQAWREEAIEIEEKGKEKLNELEEGICKEERMKIDEWKREKERTIEVLERGQMEAEERWHKVKEELLKGHVVAQLWEKVRILQEVSHREQRDWEDAVKQVWKRRGMQG